MQEMKVKTLGCCCSCKFAEYSSVGWQCWKDTKQGYATERNNTCGFYEREKQ